MDVDFDLDMIEESVEYPRNSTSELLEWMNSIDILKHVTEEHLGDMFVDGVLFFHVLRELFEEEIENADGIAEEVLPSENYLERLLNWRIINDKILEKLKIGRSSWFLEYCAKGNALYLMNLLNALREIAPVQRPKYVERDIITQLEPSWSSPSFRSPSWRTVDTDYYNDMIYKAKSANRSFSSRTRRPSPFPRMAIANERVLWGGPPRYQPQHSYSQQRSTPPSHFQKRVSTQRQTDYYRYYGRTNRFRTQFKANRSRSSSYDDRFKEQSKAPPPVETYCFLERTIRKRWNKKWKAVSSRRREVKRRPLSYTKQEKKVTNLTKPSVVSDDVEVRFRQLLKHYTARPDTYEQNLRERGRYALGRYLYRYYRQYKYEHCNFCNLMDEDED